jgi:hypothetical protein
MTIGSTFNSLYELLVPIANLSVSEKNKILLGEIGMVELMLTILRLDDNVSIGRLGDRLDYSKTLASQVCAALIVQNSANSS